MKKIQFFILIIFLVFLVQKSYSYEAKIEYDEVFVNYQELNYDYWKKEGNDFLYLARKSKNPKMQLKLYGEAAGAYQTVTKINPAQAENMAILGHIYGKMNQISLAKSYLDRSLNLDFKNPIVNNYYGIFEQDERNYRKALHYYKISYQNGMANNYDLNYNMGIVYSKLGELTFAKQHYSKAYSIKSSKELKNKINLMDKLKK